MLKTENAASDAMPQKYCNIDFLRGIAAIVILLWHYQHFYFPEAGINPIAGRPEIQPFFDLFSWFYIYGASAVQFFWIISGFVFFHAYEQRRNISIREFFSHRFSRLYPLHFITLCIITALQFISLAWLGKFQIYPLNDIFHFFLNLFMASHWGFQEGWSFNAPIWSISIEILVYIMFFVFLKAFGVRLITVFAWFLWSMLFYKNSQTVVFECAALFALGGVVNQINRWLTIRFNRNIGIVIAAACAAGLSLCVYAGWGSAKAIQWGIFPALIWLAASLEANNISSNAIGISFGNITYSSYLLHAPMQIMAIMIMDGILESRAIISSPAFLVAYLFVVIIAAALTYKFVEIPLKIYCKKFLEKQLF